MITGPLSTSPLALNGVSHEFGINKPLFTNLSFSFFPNLSYALKGPSGSGKTTLLHILGNLLRPIQGRVEGSGLVKRFVFQQPMLLDELSVIENITIGATWTDLSPAQIEQQSKELLEDIGLADKAHDRPRSLSVGQQQRVSLARALMGQPDFLLADEPTAALDKTSAEQVITLLKKYQQHRPMGIIIASHDPAILAYVDTILDISLYSSQR